MTRVDQLTEWVRSKHEGQMIKISGLPYFDHLTAVAGLVSPILMLGYECGLCHDLIEKTGTTPSAFFEVLVNFGYDVTESQYILNLVAELSDAFTKTLFPGLNKEQRKFLEDERLATISPDAQTVKYADLIYNVTWMMKYDREHAAKYLRRKEMVLTLMNSGNTDLHAKISRLIQESLATI
jgi:(p)ppGpp synthase/HD superfamily hydrolase